MVEERHLHKLMLDLMVDQVEEVHTLQELQDREQLIKDLMEEVQVNLVVIIHLVEEVVEHQLLV